MDKQSCIHKVRLQFVASMLLFFCSSILSYGQSLVKGTVVDGAGEPVIGAYVQIKGMSGGAITDLDGKFELEVTSVSDPVLVVTCLGFEVYEETLNGRTVVNVTLHSDVSELDEVTVVAYGTQKKETLTGAISSVKTEALLKSPNPSVANSLAGQIPGLSSVATSGQPGNEDPSLYIRGVGSLSESASSPLILVDGVERSFFQMDPNEIESVTVLKDASATAVFGVRGANGVILVTTRRGEEGKAKIQVTSSVGVQSPTRLLEMADSYTYAMSMNERDMNDGKTDLTFDEEALTHFRLGDEPIMYPNHNWRKELMKSASLQTQHNVNISGGTKDVRYFISAGFLYQDGLMKQFKDLDYNNNYNYTRYNYRANLDFDLTKTTTLKLGLGGVVGVTHSPNATNDKYDLFHILDWAQPFSEVGVVDGKMVRTDQDRFPEILMGEPVSRYYGKGYHQDVKNTMNMDLVLTQKLDFITEGLSVEVKGAYNTTYTNKKTRSGSVEIYYPQYLGTVEGMPEDDPNFDKTIVYKVDGSNTRLGYTENNSSRSRDWYFEASIRYSRKFGEHNVGALVLYNQNKKYYPSQWTSTPTAYLGLVGRITYDYASKYIAEFDFGYNGSENFAPGNRFGAFPAGSIGWVISEEKWMKRQRVVDFLKLRASVGLVGNDNMSNNRFLYLADSYDKDLDGGTYNPGQDWKIPNHGYYFGVNDNTKQLGAVEKKLGNPNVTWETALKSNLGLEAKFLNYRLSLTADVFFENRTDILISRNTVPIWSGLDKNLLPVVNMGTVHNKGYEIDLRWDDRHGDFLYFIDANVSYSKNKIIEQDEVEPNEPYMWRTGKPVGTVFGYEFVRFYTEEDFADVEKGILKEGYADPQVAVFPGDCMYEDLNGDGVIDTDDVHAVGFSTRPSYTFGLNYGITYKGWSLTMNWTGVTERSLVLSDIFRKPFNGETRGLLQMHAEECWRPENAATATQPRISTASESWNYKDSSLWTVDGSYIKLKTLQIGYTFSDSPKLKRAGIESLGINLSGYNLLTFDYFKLQDPESKPNTSNTYPITRTVSFGVNITF